MKEISLHLVKMDVFSYIRQAFGCRDRGVLLWSTQIAIKLDFKQQTPHINATDLDVGRL